MGFSLNPLHALDNVVHAGEKIIGDGTKDFKDAMKDAAKVITHLSPSEIGHTALDIAGMVPVVGTVANLANAGWYAAEGDWTDAAMSAAAAIPVGGEAVDAAKLGRDGVKLAEDGIKAERVIKDGTEAASTAKNAEKGLNAAKAAGDAGAEAVGKGAEAAGKAGVSGTGTRVAAESAALRQTGSGSILGSADEAYDAIRASTTDVASIAENTGYKASSIQKVKDHLFTQEHLLDRYESLGVPARWARFDSDIGIAEAWQRLESGTHGPADLQLLRHETAESWYMRNVSPSYNAAHNFAQRRFPAPGF